jgi:hypothetical protein
MYVHCREILCADDVETTAAFFKEWNETLIEDSMACAYAMLLIHIPHDALYSLWPCNPLVATPWNLIGAPVFRLLANDAVLEVVGSAERVAALGPKTVFVGDSIACNRHSVPILCKHYPCSVVTCTEESNRVRDCFKAAGVEIHVVEFDELLRLFLGDLMPFEDSVIFDMVSPLLEQIVLKPESGEWRELLMSTAFVPPSLGRGSKLCKPGDLFEECSEFKATLRKFGDFPGGGFKQLKAEDPKLIALKHLGLKSQLTWHDLEQVVQSVSDEVDGQQYEHAKAVLAFLNTVPNPRFQQDSPCNAGVFRKARWLPAKRPSTNSLPWKTPETLLQPCSQLCLHADRYLLGFASGVLDSKLNQVLRDLLGFTQHYVQVGMVVTNLIHFLEWRTERAESTADFTDPDEAEDVMQRTYAFLADAFSRQETQPEVVAALTKLQSRPWIACTSGVNAMFVVPSQIVLPAASVKVNLGVSHLAPHFYPLPHPHRQLRDILESLGAQELNTTHFEQTLISIGNAVVLSDEQITQCVAILGVIVADPSFSSNDALLVPTNTGVLRRVSEVFFDNAPFVEDQMKTSLHIAHAQLSLDLATKSGLNMVTLELMKVLLYQ